MVGCVPLQDSVYLAHGHVAELDLDVIVTEEQVSEVAFHLALAIVVAAVRSHRTSVGEEANHLHKERP